MVYWFTWQIGTSDYNELKERVQPHDFIVYDKTMNNAIVVFNLMDLEDGWNDPEQLAGRLLMIIDELKKGRRVILMCAAGISRSNGLAIGVLMLYHNLWFDDAEKIVKTFCPRANPMPDLMDAIKQAIWLIDVNLMNGKYSK